MDGSLTIYVWYVYISISIYIYIDVLIYFDRHWFEILSLLQEMILNIESDSS